MKINIRSKRLQKGQELIPCGICYEEIQRQSMSKHLDAHNLSKLRFRCGKCSKNFTTATRLKNHEAMHTGENIVKKPKIPIGYAARRNLARRLER